MFDIKSVILLCLSLAVYGAFAKKVSYIDPCRYDDSECILKSSKKAMPYIIHGDPNLGIPSFDPFELQDVNGDNGEFKLKFNKIIVKRIPECEIIKVERPDKLKLNVELLCPLTATGHYVVGGKLLVLDIEGDGQFEIKTAKVKIEVSIRLKVINKNGQEYYKFSGFDFKYEALEKVYFTLENLFHGDKDKAKPVLSILDQSWKEVIYVIGRPVIKELLTGVVDNIGKLIVHVPCKELEVD